MVLTVNINEACLEWFGKKIDLFSSKRNNFREVLDIFTNKLPFFQDSTFKYLTLADRGILISLRVLFICGLVGVAATTREKTLQIPCLHCSFSTIEKL